MGSFAGHVLPGTLFLFVGMWHTWSTIVRYVSDPRSFHVRVWHPFPGYGGRLKYLELYVITVGSFIDMFIELLYSTHLKILVNGVLNPSHMNNFEHSGMLLMFAIFGVITLIYEKTSYLAMSEGALCLIASAAFTAEYFLFNYHSTTHKGLEGYYHQILVLLIGLCVLSAIAMALMPTSFQADLCSGIVITLQAIWFFQIAFTLYGPMMPEGCSLKNDHHITCTPTEYEVRGELLANFQLFLHVFCVLAATAGVYVYAVSEFGLPAFMNSGEDDDDGE